MRRPVLTAALMLGLLGLLLAAYWPALHGSFLWDDDAHVTRPDLLTVHGLARIWTEPGATQQYYPVLHSAFWVEHRLWGGAALGYHLTNLVLHGLSALLLYSLLRRLALPGALLAAAVFALHPVCVESVAWISEQKNTLSTAFALLAALVYLRFDKGRGRGAYGLATLLFLLALLSKSVTATLPAALLVILWWRRGRLSWKSDVLPLVPWFLLSAAAAAMTAHMEREFVGAGGADFSLGAVGRLLLSGRIAWFYFAKVLWPSKLIFNYPRWTVDPGAAWQYLFPAAMIGVLAALLALRGRSRGPLAAALLFVGLLFPALGFIDVYPFVFSYVADHFQYLAAAALISALAAGCAIVAGRLPHAVRGVAPAAGACLLVLLSFLSWRQSSRYCDSETFYRAILAGNPASWLAQDNLGVVLVSQGRFSEASECYREAIRLNPRYPEAYNNLGNVLARSGRFVEAADAYQGALRARPTFAAAEYNWGNAMSDAGLFREAQTHFRNAIGMQPASAEAHDALANALANSGRLPEAVGEYREAIRIRPGYPQARANLGLDLAEQGRWAEALAEISEAVRLQPGYAEAHAYLGFALAGSGRLEEAIAEYRQSLRLGRDNPDVHYQMGTALRALGRDAEAEAEFSAARRLKDRP